MNKKLIPMEGGMAVVLEIPLLAIIGAEGVTEMELTTDGQRLILSPLRPARREAPTPVSPGQPNVDASGFDADNPKESLRVMRVLQAKHGFTQEHFRQLHHFGPKASLQAHINYCAGTGRFKSETNPIVGQRLYLCLQLREKRATWEDAIARARKEYPFPATVEAE